jgi:hypothetical protein
MSCHVHLLPNYFHSPFAFLSADRKAPYTSNIPAHSFNIVDKETFEQISPYGLLVTILQSSVQLFWFLRFVFLQNQMYFRKANPPADIIVK